MSVRVSLVRVRSIISIPMLFWFLTCSTSILPRGAVDALFAKRRCVTTFHVPRPPDAVPRKCHVRRLNFGAREESHAASEGLDGARDRTHIVSSHGEEINPGHGRSKVVVLWPQTDRHNSVQSRSQNKKTTNFLGIELLENSSSQQRARPSAYQC